jgi:hypothetical protein
LASHAFSWSAVLLSRTVAAGGVVHPAGRNPRHRLIRRTWRLCFMAGLPSTSQSSQVTEHQALTGSPSTSDAPRGARLVQNLLFDPFSVEPESGPDSAPAQLGLFCAFRLRPPPPAGLLQSAIRNPQSAILALRHKLGLFCAFRLRPPPPPDIFQSAIRNPQSAIRGLGPQIGFVLQDHRTGQNPVTLLLAMP